MENILSENRMEKVSIPGLMEIPMKGPFKKGQGQVGEYWREDPAKSTKGNLKMTWSMEKGDSTLNPANRSKVYSRRERECLVL